MLQEYLVRTYKTSDYPKLISLWESLNLFNRERGDNENVIDETLKRGGQIFILTHGKKIIGATWLTTDGRRLYLSHFGILKKYQGQKLSYLLLKEVFKYAKKLNLQIKLEVHKNNIIAQKLYKGVGFKYLGDYDTLIIRDVKNTDF